jgi:hypothetical protein
VYRSVPGVCLSASLHATCHCRWNTQTRTAAARALVRVPLLARQLSEARSQREELLAELAGLSNQVTALQAEIDGRDEKMGGLEAAAEQANKGACEWWWLGWGKKATAACARRCPVCGLPAGLGCWMLCPAVLSPLC